MTKEWRHPVTAEEADAAFEAGVCQYNGGAGWTHNGGAGWTPIKDGEVSKLGGSWVKPSESLPLTKYRIPLHWPELKSEELPTPPRPRSAITPTPQMGIYSIPITLHIAAESLEAAQELVDDQLEPGDVIQLKSTTGVLFPVDWAIPGDTLGAGAEFLCDLSDYDGPTSKVGYRPDAHVTPPYWWACSDRTPTGWSADDATEFVVELPFQLDDVTSIEHALIQHRRQLQIEELQAILNPASDQPTTESKDQ